MANRPVFGVRTEWPFVRIVDITFDFHPGLSAAQKRRNVTAIHEAYQSRFPERKVLEISSKSMQEGGEKLSAFFLQKFVPSLGRTVAVENVYQSGKVFEFGGPYTDLLTVTPRESKKDERLKTSGKLIGFRFEDKDYPIRPASIFYDYIYINALMENEELANILLQYDAFTDVEFNPAKGVSCQAQAAAEFVSLSRADLLDQARDFDSFLKLFRR